MLDFANKRWIGGLNLLTNRGRHYHTSAFETMVEDFNQGVVDHVVCTGDVTNLALEQEFRFARELFDRIGLGPRDVTVLPGNHDAYVAQGNQYFSDIFAPYHESDEGWREGAGRGARRSGSEPREGARWPVVRLRGPVAIIGLSTSLQTPWFTAYGKLGAEQLSRLRAILADPRLDRMFRLVAIHHPPVGKAAHSKVRGLRDWRALADVIAEVGAELVIHGHEHRDMRGELAGPDGEKIEVLGVQSGTYEANRPERTARYRIFEIEPVSDGAQADKSAPDPDRAARPTVVGHRLRRWDSGAGVFTDDPGEARAGAVPRMSA